LRKLCAPENEAELAVIRGLLEGEKINFFVHNDYFGSLEIGPNIHLYNRKTIMVSEDHYDRAIEIISSFVASTKGGKTHLRPRHSLIDKIRMIFEVVFFNWVMPGRKWEKREKAK
jgi:hypothetical protein